MKYAAGLAGDVTLGFAYRGRTLSEVYGSGDELFEAWYPLGDDPAAELPGIVDAFEPDVIHSHNLPDELTVLALDSVDVPVIHDVHDMQSLRRTPYEDGFPEPADPLALERRAAEESAALVTISPELVAELAARYRLPHRVVAYANYALARDLPATLPPGRDLCDGPPRLVYQGTLSTNGGHYDLRELFAAIAEQGISLDVHMARVVPEYREIPGIRVHDPLPAAELLRELVHYDFGWAGFNASLNGAHLDTALPNKLYEYLGCGLPVITLRHRALRRMLREEGVGIALDDVRDLAAALTSVDVGTLRRRVAARRARYTVEAQIDRIAALYRDVAAAGGDELRAAATAAG
jgi:glycosyltransferase involved in cell wall biosynthesis